MNLKEEYQHFLDDWHDEISFEDWLIMEVIYLRRVLKTRDEIIDKLTAQLPG